MKNILLLLILCSGMTVSAQEISRAPNPIRWTFSYEVSKTNTDEITLHLKAMIEKDWHMYSQKAVTDGPVPTSFVFADAAGKYVLSDTVAEPAGETKIDPAFATEVTSFSQVADFTQKIIRKTNGVFYVEGDVEFMCCNNMQCLPPKKVHFNIEIPAK